MTEIRDPVHGPITLSRSELEIVDSLAFQRLRNIKQLGFAEHTFPGSTHTRYLHSLGACHLAGRVFDSVFETADWLSRPERDRFRQAVRLAALLHDIGHPPLSHTVERLLPARKELDLPLHDEDGERPANHEEMSLALMTRTELTTLIDENFGSMGVTAPMVAGLVAPRFPASGAYYEVGGRNMRPILNQIIASELDIDRMDYLLRDSYFTGASYGHFDHDWLIRSLTYHEADQGNLCLALNKRAILTFEDFLLSRYHMFLMVYFHQRTNAYDRMLLRFFESLEPAFRFPADLREYVEYDDAHLLTILRAHASNPWAERILNRRPLRLILDLAGQEAIDLEGPLTEALVAEGIEPEWIASTGVLSKYYASIDPSKPARSPAQTIFVKDYRLGQVTVGTLGESTDLFARYHQPTYLKRLHVLDVDRQRAREIARQVLSESTAYETVTGS